MPTGKYKAEWLDTKTGCVSGEETFEALRSKDRDDMILSCALAVWYGERMRPSPGQPAAGGTRDGTLT